MGPDEPTHHDLAGELHAQIVRTNARKLRADQRRMATYCHQRGWPHHRICEALDLTIDILARLLTLDGRTVCTECAFSRHHDCDTFLTEQRNIINCDCYCRTEPRT